MKKAQRLRKLHNIVFHCGPAVNETGGISTVIGELTASKERAYTHDAIATWSSKDKDFGLLRAIRAMRLLMGKRAAIGPFWVHLHVSERGSFVREGLIGYLMSLVGCGLAITIHGADFVGGNGDWSESAARRLLKRANVIFCLGPISASIVSDLAPATRCVVLSNPLNLPEQALSDLTARSTTVIFGGELSRRKGFDLLKEAWPLVMDSAPGSTCRVYGPPADVAAGNLPEGMLYHGEATRQNLMQALTDAQIACLPSRREVLPMFVLESMARGLAVVTTSAGELGQFGSEQGITRTDLDAVQLADAISRLAKDPLHAQELGQRSQNWIFNNATTDHVLSAMEKAYTKSSGVLI